MPLKLSIGLSRKAGEANYGSRGATVGLEMEVDANLVHQPRRLEKRIAYMFQLARQSVDRELAGPQGQGRAGQGRGYCKRPSKRERRRAGRRRKPGPGPLRHRERSAARPGGGAPESLRRRPAGGAVTQGRQPTDRLA